jgi:hypothetical protein
MSGLSCLRYILIYIHIYKYTHLFIFIYIYTNIYINLSNRLPDKWIDRLPNETFSKLEGISHAAKCNQDFFTEMVKFQSKTSDRTGSVLKPGGSHSS